LLWQGFCGRETDALAEKDNFELLTFIFFTFIFPFPLFFVPLHPQYKEDSTHESAWRKA